MKLSTVLTIDAIAAALFGIAFVIVPATVHDIFGEEVCATSLHTMRSLGITLIGLSIIVWMTRNAGPSTARNGVVAAVVVWFVLVSINDAVGTLRGTMNALAWGPVVLGLLLAVLTGIAGWSAKKSSS